MAMLVLFVFSRCTNHAVLKTRCYDLLYPIQVHDFITATVHPLYFTNFPLPQSEVMSKPCNIFEYFIHNKWTSEVQMFVCYAVAPCRLRLFANVSEEHNSSVLKMEKLCCPKTLVYNQGTTWNNKPQGYYLHLQCRENLNSYNKVTINRMRVRQWLVGSVDSPILQYILRCSSP